MCLIANKVFIFPRGWTGRRWTTKTTRFVVVVIIVCFVDIVVVVVAAVIYTNTITTGRN